MTLEALSKHLIFTNFLGDIFPDPLDYCILTYLATVLIDCNLCLCSGHVRQGWQ